MRIKLMLVGAIVLCASTVFSQTTEQEVKELIFKRDSLFWVAYNKCDVAAMGAMLSTDVEFYHDKGGATVGHDSMMKSIQQNLCANNNFRLRREAVPGTVKVFPLNKNNVPYGAIISGEHVFYIIEAGKKEYLDGHASFSQLWILNNGEWKMTRILSYDHHPAQQNTSLKEVQVDATILNRLAGKYKSPRFTIDVINSGGKMKLVVDNKEFLVKAASDTEYFMTERDLKFIFSDNKLIVKERGEVVEEAEKQ